MRVLCTSIALTAAVLVLIQLLQLLLVLGLQPDGLFILLLLLRAHTFPSLLHIELLHYIYIFED